MLLGRARDRLEPFGAEIAAWRLYVRIDGEVTRTSPTVNWIASQWALARDSLLESRIRCGSLSWAAEVRRPGRPLRAAERG